MLRNPKKRETGTTEKYKLDGQKKKNEEYEKSSMDDNLMNL